MAREARIVLDVGRDHQLSAGLETREQQRLSIARAA